MRRLASLGALLAVSLCGAAAPAHARGITIKASYRAPACPSGKPALHPLPRAKVAVTLGDRTVRKHLNLKGAADLKLHGKGDRMRVTLTLEDDLLSVQPYGERHPYTFIEELKLSKKHTYRVKVEDPLAKRGAASAWTLLTYGAAEASRSLPAGVKLKPITARYDPGRGPSAGLPDVDSTETAYDSATKQILIDSRTRADEFEPWVLLHEYGHHVLDAVADPGPDAEGQHDLTRSYPGKPALAWSEGFAHAFAAIALKNPVLGTQCRRKVNLSTAPATPASSDGPRYNQYHEISVAGVVWSLADKLGLKRLLAALHTFHLKYAGPESLREARDALIEDGVESSEADHQELTDLFARQKIGWGFALFVTTRTSWTGHDFLYFRTQGPAPYGTCDENGSETPPTEQYTYLGAVHGADGSLPYAWQDDCYTAGTVGSPGAESNEVDIPYPAPSDRGHPEQKFTVSAMWHCEPPQQGEPACPAQQHYDFVFFQRGPFVGPGDCTATPGNWCFESADSELGTQFSLPPDTYTPIAEFDALGNCKSLLTGEDCGR
jgi:hypothetical protein